ncbi:alpha-ketoglutarate-dependent taurine dioxygenase [Mycolicibacterium murale]|uniref:Alpha-ketoglutarate-dependent taurine dioxygenase n=1 Tax=Mycolicibacterium murale TaxID=182220 RepID=A0A7I9WFS6_9MYCO|nr:TauD/TfdA family dioxygenase [Mycolicibacterium murale]MCV7182989.1 TauD/TfdA family dioxygenase [Mycolicibacterium murale]GFG56544.1 alpha-ketoglutarate-dependent taurine dioxygenase [Mycolicibacterium murale]
MTTAPQPPHPTVMAGYPVLAGPFGHLAAERERLSALRWKHFQAKQIGATLGAAISGVDLDPSLDEAVITELRHALHEYKVLFFRDQTMTGSQHVAVARRFGDLEVHPVLAKSADEDALVRFEKNAGVYGMENLWHQDVTWRSQPSMAAMLHAVTVPAIGGDTLFSDMYAAYDALDEQTRDEIDDLYAVHDFTHAFGKHMDADQAAEMRAKHPPVRHPVVCTHAVTGRKHLYVNRAFVSHFEGRDRASSLELLDRLCRFADYPEHQVRFTWTDKAVAFWDNRALQHYAASDYWPQVRTMERASIIGPTPVR